MTNRSYKKNQILNYENLIYSTFGVLFSITILSGAILANYRPTSAESAKASVNVAESCTLSGSNNSFSSEVAPGSDTEFTNNRIKATCNDGNGLALYAIGYSGDSYTSDNHTKLIHSTNDSFSIATGTDSSTSSWAFKLSAVSGAYTPIISGSSLDDKKASGDTDYSSYAAVPSEFKKVAYRASATDVGDNATGAELDASYQVHIASLQPAGTYTGKIKYVLVHPQSADTPEIETPATKLYMQNATSDDCGKTMYDIRDEEGSETAYTTAEIVELCWMTTNLNLAGGTELSSANTNVPENYSTDTVGFTNGNTLPVSSETGFSKSANAYVYNSGSTTCGDEQPCYSYYSWRAATAGYNSTSSSTPVEYDICPSGWRLSTKSELDSLYGNYNTGEALKAAPFSAIYAGSYLAGSFYDGGAFGSYWSSTADSTNNAHSLDFGSNAGVDSVSKRSGNSVRCVMKN